MKALMVAGTLSVAASSAIAASVHEVTAISREIRGFANASNEDRTESQDKSETIKVETFDTFVERSIALNASVPDGGSAITEVDQTTELLETGVKWSGSFRHLTALLADEAGSDSKLFFGFSVLQPVNYLLVGDVSNEFLTDIGSLQLAVLGSSDTIVDESLSSGTVVNSSGVLELGTYALNFDLPGSSGDITKYEFELKLFTDNGPVVVPLPPAAWGGLATLGVMGAAALRRRFAH